MAQSSADNSEVSCIKDFELPSKNISRSVLDARHSPDNDNDLQGAITTHKHT